MMLVQKHANGFSEEGDMAAVMSGRVLAEAFGPSQGAALRVKQAVLVVAGIAVLALAAKIKLMVPPSPVPVNMGTFAVLTIAAAYGPRLGLTTILGYMLVGALGFDVFAGSSAEKFGIEYMMGGTGGYLAGYVLATLALGALARRGWDRSVPWMAGAMLIGNALIYVPGLLWLGQLYGWDKPILAWGLTPFIIGDVLKLALAALVLPAAWKLVGKARA
jgi:biotin transport system substrate-specific component